MREPTTWNATTPRSHKITRIAAIVYNIILSLVNNTLYYLHKPHVGNMKKPDKVKKTLIFQRIVELWDANVEIPPNH